MEPQAVGRQKGPLLGDKDHQISRGMAPDRKKSERYAAEIDLLPVAADHRAIQGWRLTDRLGPAGISLAPPGMTTGRRSSATIASAIRGWERKAAAPSPARTRIAGNRTRMASRPATWSPWGCVITMKSGAIPDRSSRDRHHRPSRRSPPRPARMSDHRARDRRGTPRDPTARTRPEGGCGKWWHFPQFLLSIGAPSWDRMSGDEIVSERQEDFNPLDHYCVPQKSEPLITLDRVTLRVGDKMLLPGTSWEIKSGENWAILGPNGSGKTALARAVKGDIPHVRGRLIRHDPEAEGRTDRVHLLRAPGGDPGARGAPRRGTFLQRQGA